jgi:NTP pyrophosphatase (non-canonical NTP hydrolase)
MSIDAKTLTFAGLQSQVGDWSRRNFPNNSPADPFYGIVEEVGELSHAILKARQGIRGTKAEHEAAERDAIGDIVIYLADFAGRNELELEDGVNGESFAELDADAPELAEFSDHSDSDRCFRTLVQCMSALSHRPSNLDAGDTLDALAAYCHHRGWSLAEIVTETWGTVSRRDWTANAANGQTEGVNP